jgi:lincosamide nucleotidyltransferase A/C/D/E
MMSAADVLAVLDVLDSAGISVWIDGGWGIDALLGEQTRPHEDLDIALAASDTERFLSLMAEAGFSRLRGARPNFVLADAAGREVDVHLVDLASTRPGPDGTVTYGALGLEYEVGSLEGTGSIGGRAVRCITADFQMKSHLGYAFDDDDVRDVGALSRRFVIPLPAPYLDYEQGRAGLN